MLRVALPVVLLSAIGYWLSATPALAQVNTGIDFGTATGLSTQDIRVTVAKIIRAAFGLLGIVGLGIVLAGGFLWMTSSGNEEKLEKAKKLLTNGAIGLTIMLLSFAITQFVISRLNAALYGSGAVTIATEGGGGGLPPGALPGGCVDPGGAVPFVCSISPMSGPVGAYVTIRGYRFAPYTGGMSSVRIGGVLAPVVACGGGPNWADNLIVVEVPTLESGRSHPVQVTAGGGGVSGNPIVFGVTSDPVGPQIACIVPNQGPEGTILSIDGKNFGAVRGSADVRFGGGVSVTSVTSWIDTAIGTSVPAGAQTGEVTVVRDAQTSNGYPLTVTCSVGTQCSVSNCCTEGRCVEASACAPGGPPSTVGASCDGNTATPACEPIACGGGLRCEPSACTCQQGPVITGVSPQTLVSTTDGTAYRRVEDVPAGTQTVIAPNGSPGNYLSIRGRGFGATPGRVIFLGAAGATDDVGATLAACTTAWSDQQVVVAIPAGAALGPIRIETTDPQFFDATDDVTGSAFEHFRPNTTTRPGVCAIAPSAGQIGASASLTGVQFGASRGADDAVLFGDLSSGATSAWGATAITTVVPTLAEGAVPVRVRVGGEFSNEVAFTRAAAPRVPRIQEIIPARGGPGQYVTIRGEYFGSEIGKLLFARGTDVYEVVPRFPDLCQQNWWRDTEITARIPANNGEWGPPAPPSDFNALGTYTVRVQAREGATLRSSNAVSFAVTADQPSPGICAITPSSGPAQTSLQLIGERFGGAPGSIRMFDGIAAVIAAGNWADGVVRGVLVPATARAGPVRLWHAGQLPERDDDPVAPGLQGNQGSNPVTFEVRDCRAGGTSACSEGQICCGNGTCVANAAACATGPNRGSFQWTFATGVIPKVPRVVESCVPADASAIPSPSPWDQQGQGQEACVNANIAIRFTTSMAIANGDDARRGMQIFQCGGGSNAAAAMGGDFEGAGLAGGWVVVDGARTSASAETVVAPATARGGTGVLRLTKLVAGAADQPRTTDLPRDAPVDRHYFAIKAPDALITDTNGTTYTARVFVRGENPNQNPNMRAGVVIGRSGGPQPTDPGWWQQVANEVTLNGTWQELSASITFDAGLNKTAPGFVRLYLTGPPIGAPAAADDTYTARFDDLEVVRQGDVCATREEVNGLTFQVASEGGRLQLENNIVTVAPAAGSWMTGTWYEVVVAGNDGTMPNAGVPTGTLAFRGASTPQLRLDGDKNGEEGGNYRFRFRTRTSAAACAIQSVVTTPSDAVATQRGPTSLAGASTAEHPGLTHLRADGRADPAACFTLATSGMDWSWTAVQPAAGSPFAAVNTDDAGRWCAESDECAVVSCSTDAACAVFGVGTMCNDALGRCTVDFCTANRCNFTRVGAARNAFSNTVTARGIRETPIAADGSPQPVEVRATVAAATPRTGTSDVIVRFEKPRVTAVYPISSCQQACPNGRIVAVTNIDLDPATVIGNVQVYACVQENCRRGELTSVGGMTATACDADAADDFCTANKVGNDPQVIISGATLSTNTSYRVVIRGTASTGVRSVWGVPLDQLNYADNAAGAIDAYSWTFRTRSEPCNVSRVDVSPSPLILNVIGERATVRAVPFGAPDACSPAGQPIDAETLDWGWSMPNPSGVVARFTAVNAGGTFPNPLELDQLARTTRVAGPSCTLQCLRPGSRRAPGICGNGVTEIPAEECERTGGAFASWCDPATCLLKGAQPEVQGGTCGNGVINDGEECEERGPDGALSATGQFPVWCDPATCLNRGSVVGGSVCGNGNAATPEASAGDGEDCDDGNTSGGDGCSSTCLAEGAPRQYHPTDAPNGILARCGDGVVADGQAGRPDGGEECDPGPVSRATWTSAGCDYERCVRTGARTIAEEVSPGVFGTCGNGTIQVGEQCDDGAVGQCSALSGVNTSRRCTTLTSEADCGAPGRCEDLQPMDGDGCASNCLREGSSITWRHARTGITQPSMCGDGVVHTGEACDLGSAGSPDPLQIVQAIGSGTANAVGTQLTAVAAIANGVTGNGEVRLQCGYSHDTDVCPNPESVPAGTGVDRQGCCRARPIIIARIPEPDEEDICRNARIAVQFDQLMDSGSVGAVRDLATGSSFMKGAVLEHRVGATWTAVNAAPELVETIVTIGGQERTVSELSFALIGAFGPSESYRVRVLDTGDDTPAQQVSIRSADGVRLGDDAPGSAHTWRFSTGSDVCTVSRVEVIPPSYLLQRRESRARLRVQAVSQTPTGDQQIGPVSGYQWTYAWSSNATDITVKEPITTGTPTYPCDPIGRCTFKPAEPTKNGDAFGIATAAITENVFGVACTTANAATVCGAGRTCTGGHCVGESFTGRSRLRALICENPWPAVTSPATWEPYPRTTDTNAAAMLLRPERISLAYCRDQGDRKVCRAPGVVETPDARTCAQDGECTTPQKCLPALRDDLPALAGVVSNDPPETSLTVDELRKEFFLLPRDVAGSAVYYCSVSGERCDQNIAGMCPAGEFCQLGNDAVGLRVYENAGHVSAARWFRDQGFTEGTTPVEVDGYRGVQAGRSTYLNAANIGSVFTNMIVLSVNDTAVADTRVILNQILQGLRFNTDLADQNERVCARRSTPTALVGRCSGNRAECPVIGAACAGENAGTCEVVACTSDVDCRWMLPTRVPFTNGACRSLKDKLARDVRRLEDLNDIRFAIERYGNTQARCSVTPQSCDPGAAVSQCPAGETCFTSGPGLMAGTFVPGLTSSRWPSWQQELGTPIGAAQLPVDPLNVFGGACSTNVSVNEQYDQQTCWNLQTQTYTVPAGSYLYQYRRQPTGQWSVSASFEYVGTTPPSGGPVQSWIPAPAATIVAEPTNVPRSYGVSGSCGDGALQTNQGETCDPPGLTGIPAGQTATCTTGGRTGSQFWTCGQDCTWSAAPSACGALCGNFVRDGSEECDAGPTGGRVPVGHPAPGTVPGITSGTQYECSTICTWVGGRCGNGTVQSAYGEQCDDPTNVATTPAESSPTTQYACTSAASTNPCKATGGYCGDGMVQAANAEQCEGSQTRSCINGDGNLVTPAAIAGGGTLVSGSLPWRTTTGEGRIRFDHIVIRDQGGTNGSVRLALETSNDPGDLSNLTRDQIEAALSGRTINDYNPGGAQGGAGLYHRLRIQTKAFGAADTTYVTHGTMWALASTTHQTSSMIIDSMPSGDRVLRIVWDNDWSSAPFDSNLMLHRVTLEGAQVRSCGAPGQTTACKVINTTTGAAVSASATGAAADALGWGVCQAAGANCGDGVIHDGRRADQVDVFDCDGTSTKPCVSGHGPNRGEQCDDGGKGRCSNNAASVCSSDTDCGAGNRCDQNADLCTSTCTTNMCGDGATLAPTCVSGTPAKIGQSCITNTDCGASGVCRTEQCDLGIGNWRAECTGATAAARALDPRCVPNAVCEYGRTCNYCTTACSVATKRGGFCGDSTVNGSEVCEPNPNALWTANICTPSCSAICPTTYVGQVAHFPSNVTEVSLAAAGETTVTFPGCRLLGGLAFDVAMNDSVGRMSVVIITDRSGSMGSATDTDSKIARAKRAIADDGGLIDRLFAGRGADRVRVGLVSYKDSVTITTADAALGGADQRAALKAVVRAYDASGGTRVAPALSKARDMLLADGSGGAKVVILLSDGALDDDYYRCQQQPPPSTSNCSASPSNPTAVATAVKQLPASLYTALIGSSGSGSATQMCEWSSDLASICNPLQSDRQYSFAGTDIQQLYNAIGNAITTVTFTVFRDKVCKTTSGAVETATDPVCAVSADCSSGRNCYNSTFATTIPKVTSQVSFDGNDVTFSTTGLAEQCRGPRDSTFKIRADFFGSSAARVTLTDPNARMCPGPPWKP